ncbi:MAG: SirB2 family protein [Neisseriaceae bacterium]
MNSLTYDVIHHLHPLIAVSAVLLFNYKFWRTYVDPQYKLPGLLSPISRVFDILILLTGGYLASCKGSTILFDVRWFDFKLLLVIVYIVTGILCLRAPKASSIAIRFYLLAMASVAGIIYLVKVQPF